jgi:ABC-type glycerol-3-phosphate transport system substrate-binding protein
MEMKKFIRLTVLALVMIILLTGCVKTVNLDEVRKYADPATENILLAMNEQNYANFIKDFDNQMKEAIPESKFPEIVNDINGKVGNYMEGSKVLKSAIDQNGIITVIYVAKFTEEQNDVTVRTVFKDVDGEMKVTGLWFDSPKLRGK